MRRERLSAARLMLAGLLVAALALSGCQSTGQSVMLGAALGAGLGSAAVAGEQAGEVAAGATEVIFDVITGQDPAARAPRSKDDDYKYEYVLVGALIGGLVGWLIGNKRINKASGSAGGGLVLSAQEAALDTEYPMVSEGLVFGDGNLYQGNQGLGLPLTAASAGEQAHGFDLYDSLIRLNGRTAALAECLPVLNPRKRVIAPGSAEDWCADSYDASPASSPASDADSASDSRHLE